MAETKIDVPTAPGNLPPAMEKKWKEAYVAAFKEAQNDWQDDEQMQKQVALREANRVVKTPEITSYGHAKGLEDWHFVLREPSADGKTLRVVTRHGKKYTFDIPAKEQKKADDANKNGNGGGAGTPTT
jgi:hypothetical protein